MEFCLLSANSQNFSITVSNGNEFVSVSHDSIAPYHIKNLSGTQAIELMNIRLENVRSSPTMLSHANRATGMKRIREYITCSKLRLMLRLRHILAHKPLSHADPPDSDVGDPLKTLHYPKSLGSTQMVEFLRRTKSQSATRHKNTISAHRNMLSVLCEIGPRRDVCS
jgi:hypothetical protein